jgi:hypothetical protein
MARSKQADPIPEDFGSLAAAADFWDTHDLADYVDQSREVDAEVDIQRRAFLTALEPALAKRVSAYAQEQGVSAETLINLWLSEKLSALAGK